MNIAMKWGVKALVCLLISSNIYWLNERRLDNIFIDTLSESSTKLSTHLYELDLLKEARMHEIELNGREVSLDSEIFDSHGIKYCIGDIIKENKLVLRYTELNCHTCIEEQIENLVTYTDSIGMNNIAIFTSYENPIYLSNFRKVNKVNFQIYNIKNMQRYYFEDIGLPYFFVLTPSGKITNVFIPFKEIPNFTNRYLHSMCCRFFSPKKLVEMQSENKKEV